MAVFRIHKSKDFTVMSNHHLRNKELSLKAKGLLTLMLSLPDDWDYSVLGLTALSKDGKDAVMTTLDELKTNGYLTMTQARDDKGHLSGWTYDVYETPNTEKPESGKPYAENPNTENPPQYNTNIYSTNKQSTNILNEDNNYSSRTINSTSNNNNISSSIPKKEKKGLDLSFVSIEYLGIIEKWLQHKKQKRQYYTQVGIESQYRRLLKMSNNDARTADIIVEYSIAQNYDGIFMPDELKQKNHGSNFTEAQQPRNRFCELAQTIRANGGIF